MNHNQEALTARAAPILFVVLWSTGFIGTKYVINNAFELMKRGESIRGVVTF